MNDALPSGQMARCSLDDWLSPILVKELRQGMRGRVFVVSFLILQVFLNLVVLGNVAASRQRGLVEVQTGIFWGVLGALLTLIMPLRGINAIAQEVKRHTMETVLLTRLTAWRVVFGKWSALFAQSLLLVTAVLPYVVVRYYIGGTDVVMELLGLLYFLWLSGITLALAITASAITNVVIRVLFLGASALVSLLEAVAVIQLTHEFSWVCVGWLLLTSICVPALLFELAVAGIAPPSENHSVWRRLIAVVYFGGSLALWNQFTNPDMRFIGLLFPMAALIGVCYFELSEKPRLLPRLVAPFQRFGRFGEIPGMFLLPGWPSALLFSLVVFPLATWGIVENTLSNDSRLKGLEMPLLLGAIAGSVLLPACICHLWWTKLRQVFFAVILYNVILGGLSMVIMGFDSLTQGDFVFALGLLPSLPTLLAIIGTDKLGTDVESYMFLNGITLFIVLIALIRNGAPYFRRVPGPPPPGENNNG